MKTIAKTVLTMMSALLVFDSVAGMSPLSPMEAALRLEARMVEGERRKGEQQEGCQAGEESVKRHRGKGFQVRQR